MHSEAQILVFSESPAEGKRIADIIAPLSERSVRAVTDRTIALKVIGALETEIIFADSEAGSETATRFLDEVWTRHPKTTRFLLGNSRRDGEALLNCALGPHQFVPAPVDPEKLADALSRADAIKGYVRNEKIRELVSRMRTLPNRPALSIEIMRQLRSPRASACAVGELVAKDLAISAKLIQMANSAFYSAEQQVSTPVEAVLLIGLETTAALVLSIETFAQADNLKPLYFSIDRVWKHSQSVAELARKICQTMEYGAETIAHVYTAGLLHDIGKLALALNFEEDYERVIKEAEGKRILVHQAEEQFFGTTHAETGAYLLALWGMPLPIVEAVAGHHWPAERLSKGAPAIMALRLADQLVNAPADLEAILDEYPSEFGLTQRLEKFRSLLGISKSQPPKKREVKPAAPRAIRDSEAIETPRKLPERSPVFYLAFSAVVAFAAGIAFFGAPKLMGGSKTQVQLQAKAAENQQSLKAKTPAGSDRLTRRESDTALLESFTFQRPFTLEQPPTPAPVPDHLFPFDYVFPAAEPSGLQRSPELPAEKR